MANHSPPKPQVTVAHFQKVADAASDFDRYLRDVYGGRDDSARAFNEGLRKDDWTQSAVPSMRPPMQGGHNNTQGYHQQAPYRQQQRGLHGRDVFQSEPAFDDVDPFQESKHPALPNEVNNFRQPSPDPRSINRADRSGYNDSGRSSSNTPSPWGASGGHGNVGRSQNMRDGRSRAHGTAQFDEFDEFGDVDPRSMHG